MRRALTESVAFDNYLRTMTWLGSSHRVGRLAWILESTERALTNHSPPAFAGLNNFTAICEYQLFAVTAGLRDTFQKLPVGPRTKCFALASGNSDSILRAHQSKRSPFPRCTSKQSLR